VSLDALLKEKRSVIARTWAGYALNSYPDEAARLMKREKDRFQNPVGNRTSEAIVGLFDKLLDGGDLSDELDEIVRIRAVQDFSPSQALAFVYELKRAVTEELGAEVAEKGLWQELWRLDAAIDGMALQAFDAYMGCRERVFQLRANEQRRHTKRILGLLDRGSIPMADSVEAAEGNSDMKGGKGA
jgi:hypothetical protein